MRIMNSIEHYKLDISRAPYRRGEHLSLRAGVRCASVSLRQSPGCAKALDAGHAGCDDPAFQRREEPEVPRVCDRLDGDAVLFSDEAERVYKRTGWTLSRRAKSPRQRTLVGRPLKSFLAALHRIQSDFPGGPRAHPDRLVTARSAPAHERVVRTLRAWNIRIDKP